MTQYPKLQATYTYVFIIKIYFVYKNLNKIAALFTIYKSHYNSFK